MIATHRISALKRKTISVTHGVEAITKTSDWSEAVYLVNEYVRADQVLKDIIGEDFNIFPLVAEGPTDTQKSYPYIRYSSLPVLGQIWHIHTDVIRYYVGDKDYKRLGKILTRMKDILVIDDSTNPFPIKGGRFKIHSIEFLGGTNPSGPDQEEGIIERGLNIAIIYTVVS